MVLRWTRLDLEATAPSLEKGPAPLNQQIALSINHIFMVIPSTFFVNTMHQA